jgi:septum site-determining protein MinD
MGKIIVMSSGKGGTGKTNVAINLGVGLAQLGNRVALVDGSLTTPDVSLHLGIPFHVKGLSHILKENAHIGSATFHHDSGVSIIPGNVHINMLKEFEGKKFSRLLKNLKKKHDFVLVDSAAGLGRETLSAIKHGDGLLIIANPELPSIVNASKTIQIAKDLKVKPIGVVLNRVGRHKKELQEKEIKPLLHKVPIIGRIPEDKKVPFTIKNEKTILQQYPYSKAARELMSMATLLHGKKKRQKSFLENVVSFFTKH